MTSNNEIDLVIYHGGCPDGTASAWCFWKGPLKCNTSKLYYGKIGESPPDVTGKHIVFVDFTYTANVMNEVIDKAASVIVLDHHKTALHLLSNKNPKLTNIIDMNRSGAQIAWDYVNPGTGRPWFIDDIADRDLWAWKILNSKEVTTGLNSLGYYQSMQTFDRIQFLPREYFALAGRSILNYEERIVEGLVKRAITCIASPPGQLKDSSNKTWTVKLVECDHNYSSEVGNRLVSDGSCDFSVMYRYDIVKNEWLLSCRADQRTSIDLTEILPLFDKTAGGHAKAAGMCIKVSDDYNLRTFFTPVPKPESEAKSDKDVGLAASMLPTGSSLSVLPSNPVNTTVNKDN
jgi:oligoribonuclease NrnB/cAMP/cGMP phosphodiesterase (DHH superfamily)